MRRVALTIFVSGCLLFPSLDDLTGGGDASVLDVISDAPIPPPDDVVQPPADSATDVDAGLFCAQHPSATFCADFDESTNAAAGFTNTYLNEGGVVSRDTTIYVTSPASLMIGNTALDAGASAHGAEVKATGITPQNGITLDVDTRIDKLASQGTYLEALALVINAPARSSIQLNLKGASSEVGEEIVGLDGGKTYVPHVFPSVLPMSQWVHLTIAIVFQPQRTLTVSVDQTVVIDHATLNAGFSAAGPLDVYLGNAYSPGPSDGATIHYDDALLVVN